MARPSGKVKDEEIDQWYEEASERAEAESMIATEWEPFGW